MYYTLNISKFKAEVLRLREGFKKKIVEFSTKRLPPPPLSGRKIRKTKNDLLAMKQILYDMGPLTLVRWPLYRALKV